MKNVKLIFMFFSSTLFAQVGINNANPKSTLHVAGSPQIASAADGIIAPLISGEDLRNKDDIYSTEQTGALVYVTSIPNPVSVKTGNINSIGYYYFDGSIWVALKGTSSSNTDATRFLGGSVYSRFNSITAGTPQLDNSRVIGNANGATYSVGINPFTSSKGGLTEVKGNGYKISNPSAGIFDIEFDVPMIEIYGISCNILDSYRSSVVGTYPTTTQFGNTLIVTDNSQVAFISNNIIRIKTGDQNGALSNRSFTFLVTGR